VPIRLLAIGLPLTMLLGWLVATGVLPGLGVWEALLVAVILAPTDAALGLATISNPRAPQLIRQSLNVESGLNDGMALPFFTIALAAAAESADPTQAGVVEILIRALVLSTALGAATGWGTGWLLARAQALLRQDDQLEQVLVLHVAELVRGLDEVIARVQVARVLQRGAPARTSPSTRIGPAARPPSSRARRRTSARTPRRRRGVPTPRTRRSRSARSLRVRSNAR